MALFEKERTKRRASPSYFRKFLKFISIGFRRPCHGTASRSVANFRVKQNGTIAGQNYPANSRVSADRLIYALLIMRAASIFVCPLLYKIGHQSGLSIGGSGAFG
jgi:hypothetical protein